MIIHSLRTSKNNSMFKEYLLNALCWASEEKDMGVIISTGYYWENPGMHYTHKFSASKEPNQRGLSFMSIPLRCGSIPSEISLYGCKGSKQYFKDFKQSLVSYGYNIIRAKRKGNVHAKFFAIYKKRRGLRIPIFEIIGSSNLTNPAFGTHVKGLFNHETDLIIINDTSLQTYLEKIIKGNNLDEIGDFINTRLEYSDQNTENLSERMLKFMNEFENLFNTAKNI
ncbi:MAG: hypothetical protein ACOCQD_05240 [archaeon]